jgi:aminoglycoside 6'-N-acetyltransferase I
MSIVQIVANDPLFAAYCRLRIALWPDCAEDCEADLSQGAAFLALTAAGEPAGFIEMSLRSYAEGASSSPVPFIEGWFVESAYRRQGIGRALVSAAEEWAAARGYREIGSDTGLENTVSIKAHVRLGYREVERNVCFSKQLSQPGGAHD